MSSSSPIPQLALLSGRSRWLRLHCADLEHCNDCLLRIAAYMAREMEYELAAALNKPAEAYRAELGVGRCSLERARELRGATCAQCCEDNRTLVADDAPLRHQKFEPPEEMPRALKFALGCLVVLVVALLVVALVL